MKYYLDLINKLQSVPILVVGDLMLDRFIWGNVSRISPEAPVPVVEVTKETYMPGGAGNVACNIDSLGCSSSLIGAINDDLFGKFFLEKYHNTNVDTSGIINFDDRTTIVKTRVIAHQQQVVRVDRENKKAIPDTIINKALEAIQNKLKTVKAVVLSDYGKGIINDKVLEFTITQANKLNIPILVDPKIGNFKKYKNITCITPNFLEAKQGMDRLKIETDQDIEKLGKDIKNTLKAKSILITRGEAGMSLFENTEISHIPTVAQEVYDVTGAGDTVISTLAVCLGNGLSIKDSAYISNIAAGIVVGKLGTATVTLAEIMDYLKENLCV
ncbi:MAG: D-glycero-beta-D-manno-heptose-7-phosphate kinase [bacterium]|nr:D-glycero-beta-D-manno-heptose-7-phosphate kinase [bacterium]